MSIVPPSVSVITINRNMGDAVERTISSVTGQEHPCQWVVIDGGSSDGSAELLRQAVRPGDVFVSEPDRGISDAFNKGLRLATGAAVMFMNAGDEFAGKGALGGLVAAWDHPVHRWATASAEVLDESGRTLFTRHADPRVDPWSLVRHGCRIFHQATIVEREVALAAGGFREDFRRTMDYDLWLRLMGKGILPQIVDVVVTRYRNGGVSSDPLKRWQEEVRSRSLNGMSNSRLLDVRLRAIISMKCALRSVAGPWAYRIKERLRW